MTSALEQQCRELALVELRGPKLALTQQFLAVHRVKEDESGLLIAGVVVTDQGLDVYFGLDGEVYFLVLCIIVDDAGPSVRFCRAEAKCRVYLSVTSDTVPPEGVTTILGLTPTESWQKGDPGPRNASLRRFHGWYFDPEGDGPGECDRKMDALLKILTPVSSQIARLSDRCSVCLSVFYHGYQSEMWGLHWSAQILRTVAALGVDLDIDLYASGPDLPS
jgi:hypothetical protein